MRDNPLFYEWTGYLANPVRRAEIHVESVSDKAAVFRAEYEQLTGVPVLYPGDSPPFYVWKPGTNKYGVQRRIYFNGDIAAMPAQTLGFEVKEGRAKNKVGWRINNRDFINALFAAGFLLGDNGGGENRIVSEVPPQFADDFLRGKQMMSARETAARIIQRHCSETGVRTVKITEAKKLLQSVDESADNLLNDLINHAVIGQNPKSGAVTFRAETLLDDEVEDAAADLIRREKKPEKREYLLEIFARNRGWVLMAKETFGYYCMRQKCGNTFIKDDGAPYIEVHHILPLHKGGEDDISNLSVLCAHHHRMAHFAKKAMRTALKNFLLEENEKIRAQHRG